MFTDMWCPAWLNKYCRVTPVRSLRAFGGRFHPELADAPVHSFNWTYGAQRVASEVRFRHTRPGYYHSALAEAKWFAAKAVAVLSSQNWPETGVLFSYNGTAVEPFQWGKQQGLTCVLGQMDLGKAEHDLMRKEAVRWPGWELESDRDVPPERFERREQEWGLADHIVVNSRWAYNALVRQNVSPEKMAIVPLCYEGEAVLSHPPKDAHLPIRVLWLGQVSIRKGIQYLMKAARLLEGHSAVIDVVGPIRITPAALATAPDTIHFHGPVSRSAASKWYASADFFVLPTISDGFALTQLEAMAHGLPVIVTPNCGEVVTHGVDGLIVPPGDPDALAEAMLTLATNYALRTSMSEKARVKARQYSVDIVAERLLRELRML